LGTLDHLRQSCLGVGKRPGVVGPKRIGCCAAFGHGNTNQFDYYDYNLLSRDYSRVILLLVAPSELLASAADCPQKSSAFASVRLSFILLSFFGVI
jgi:hypothetical protein